MSRSFFRVSFLAASSSPPRFSTVHHSPGPVARSCAGRWSTPDCALASTPASSPRRLRWHSDAEQDRWRVPIDYQEETTFDKIDKDAFGLAETSLSLRHVLIVRTCLASASLSAVGTTSGDEWSCLGYGSPGGGSCGSCGKPGVLGGFSKRLVGIAKRFQRPCGRLVWARTGTRLGRYFKSSTGPSAAAASTGLWWRSQVGKRAERIGGGNEPAQQPGPVLVSTPGSLLVSAEALELPFTFVGIRSRMLLMSLKVSISM